MALPKKPDRSLRILLVDDDPDTRLLCRRLLERLGHQVTVAEEGLEAMGLLRDHEWDIVLTDQNMPGACGVDVLERAFKLQPGALRLLMSSILDPRMKEEAQARGHVQAFIEKPLDRGAFEDAGRAVFAGRGPAHVKLHPPEG